MKELDNWKRTNRNIYEDWTTEIERIRMFVWLDNGKIENKNIYATENGWSKCLCTLYYTKIYEYNLQ